MNSFDLSRGRFPVSATAAIPTLPYQDSPGLDTDALLNLDIGFPGQQIYEEDNVAWQQL